MPDQPVDVVGRVDLAVDPQRCQPVHGTPGHVGLRLRILPPERPAFLEGADHLHQLIEEGVRGASQLGDVLPAERFAPVHQPVVRRVLDGEPHVGLAQPVELRHAGE